MGMGWLMQGLGLVLGGGEGRQGGAVLEGIRGVLASPHAHSVGALASPHAHVRIAGPPRTHTQLPPSLTPAPCASRLLACSSTRPNILPSAPTPFFAVACPAARTPA
eukprot:351073-Chlamydomonas_euryale.AAC.3